VKENGLEMWQQQWTNTGKGAVTKASFSVSEEQTTRKNPIFPEFIMLVTGHGKLRSYLHRFGIRDNPTCPCEEEQTSDHLIFQCKRLNKQRNDMIKQIKTTGGDWPMTNEKLVNNYL
jgi:hypothetical protein